MIPSGRLRRFHIELLHDADEFAPGDSISGAVLIEPYPSQIIAKLRVGIHGAAKVFWIKGISTRNSSQFQNTKHVSNSVDYFHVERSVFENRRASAPSGPSEHRPRLIGLTGAEEFPFVFKLPERGFPPSWKGPHGMIQYWIDAVAEVGGKESFKDHIEHPFRVVNHPDTGKLPDPKLQMEKFPVSGVACIPSAVSVVFRSLNQSYSPGEPLRLYLQMKNTSSWQISSKICLIQNQAYIARKDSTKRIRENIAQIECESVQPHTDIEIENSSLVIPKSCLPSVLNCAIIRNEYSAILHLKVRRYFAEHFEMSIPILIFSPTRPASSASLRKNAICSSDRIESNKDGLSEISESITDKENRPETSSEIETGTVATIPGLMIPSASFMESRNSV